MARSRGRRGRRRARHGWRTELSDRRAAPRGALWEMSVTYASAGQLLDALARARTTFDGDAWVGLFSENATYQADPFEPPLVGHNALRADILAASETQQQVEFTVERHWVVEATVLAAWHMSYVDRASKGRVREAGFATLEIGTDGRIERARWWSVRRQGPADD